MTRAELEAKMSEVGLEEHEKYLVRKQVGLPVGEVPERLKMYRNKERGQAGLRSILMRALANLNRPDPEREEARLAELNKNPEVLKAVELVEEVGLSHSMVMGGSVIIEGGIADPMKACRVPTFCEAIDSVGFTGRPLNEVDVLPARRVLVAHVVNKLKELGATIKKSELCHADTVDEVHELSFNGRNVGLVLMPH